MGNTGTENVDSEYESQISDIIQGSLVDLYGAKGYSSIIQTMMKICGKSEKDIITNFELFSDMCEGVFGRDGISKIVDPIKLEIDKIGEENIKQEEKPNSKKPMRLLIADDETEIIS